VKPGATPDKTYRVEALARRHDRESFYCAVEPLDRYIRTQASQDAKRSVAVTFVAVPRRAPEFVSGYYTLAATAVDVGELPATLARKLPRYPRLPATLLGRLAVDVDHRGQGLGEFLLVNAVRRSLAASHAIGSLAVIVDAIDDRARAFYEHFEFQTLPDQPRRLFLPMASIARLFQLAARRRGR
jgi:GNAT superfamily N-acetyltransferase